MIKFLTSKHNVTLDLSMNNTIGICPNPNKGTFVVKSKFKILNIEILNFLEEKNYLF
jgi:hypothetical protein